MSEYKNIADMTSDELLAFKRYIDSESAKVKDQLMVAKSTGAATGQYLPIPEYANLLSKKSYYAKKSQAIQSMLGKKKKLEKDERYTSNAESLIARLKADNTRLRQSTDISLQRNTELEAQLAAAQAEITRLRAGGCAREQGTTQYCDTAQKWERRVAQCWEYVPIRVREILQSQWRRDEQEAAHIGEGER